MVQTKTDIVAALVDRVGLKQIEAAASLRVVLDFIQESLEDGDTVQLTGFGTFSVKEKPENISRTTIKLQFVLMEKIDSVITRTKGGNIKMTPESLANGDEQEILKLAYDIGLALKRAHNKNVLHRDVKLENVFYSEKKKQYKLGDFGIAKKTEECFDENS